MVLKAVAASISLVPPYKWSVYTGYSWPSGGYTSVSRLYHPQGPATACGPDGGGAAL